MRLVSATACTPMKTLRDKDSTPNPSTAPESCHSGFARLRRPVISLLGTSSTAEDLTVPSVELAKYFTAERQGSFLLVALALASLGFAAFLWFTRSAFLAMAWPIVVLGVFQVVVGVTVALRAPGQVASLEQGLRISPAATGSAESQRISRINRNFRIVKVVEVVVIVLGLLLAVLLPHPSTGAAVGLGLLVEGAVLLAFDAFAHQRALVYTQWLQSTVT